MYIDFGNLKQKDKNLVRKSAYTGMILNNAVQMFKFDGLPEEIGVEGITWAIAQAHINGHVVLTKRNKDFVFINAAATFGNENEDPNGLDYYGIPKGFTGVTANGIDISGKLGKDGEIWWLYPTHQPSYLISMYADSLAEVDKSIDANVKKSRLAPVIPVSNSKQKTVVEEVIRGIDEGFASPIVSSNELRDILDDKKTIEPIHLTMPDQVQNIQHLNQYHDHLLKRIYTLYGMCTAISDKKAQQNASEVNAMQSNAWIIPLAMLTQAQDFCDRANATFGLSISVKFNDPWAKEYDKYMSTETNELEMKEMNGNAENENSENEPDDSTSDNSV